MNFTGLLCLIVALSGAIAGCTKKSATTLLSDASSAAENPPTITVDDLGIISLVLPDKDNPNKLTEIKNLSLDSMQGSINPSTDFQPLADIVVDSQLTIERDNKPWDCQGTLKIKDKKAEINCVDPNTPNPTSAEIASSTEDNEQNQINNQDNDAPMVQSGQNNIMPGSIKETDFDQFNPDASDQTSSSLATSIATNSQISTSSSGIPSKPITNQSSSQTTTLSTTNSRNQTSPNTTQIYSRMTNTADGFGTTVEFAKKMGLENFEVLKDMTYKINADVQLDHSKSRSTKFGYVIAISSLAVSGKNTSDGTEFDCPIVKFEIWTECSAAKESTR